MRSFSIYDFNENCIYEFSRKITKFLIYVLELNFDGERFLKKKNLETSQFWIIKVACKNSNPDSGEVNLLASVCLFLG